MTSNRPYLIRALYEWILDNSMSPFLLVKADDEDVSVPDEFVEDGKIIMNILPDAVKDLELGNEFILFSARFGGKAQQVTIPVSSVLAIYAKENGKGLIFPEEELEEEAPDTPAEKDKPSLKKKPPHLKVIK